MKKIFLIVAVMFLGTAAFSQIEKPVKWSFAVKKTSKDEAVIF